MSSIIDTASQVRAGEELPVAELDAYLKQHLDLSGTPEVTQFSGGASNWTYRLAYPNADLILRRGPAGTKAKSAHDMEREYRLQHALQGVYPYVPKTLHYCADSSVIGSDFYIMERLVGIIPRRNMPRGLNLSSAQTAALCQRVLDCLVELHRIDIDATGLRDLAKGEGYVQRQLDGWSDRYRRAKTWNVPSGSGIIKWLYANRPSHETICLTHNDFRFDNVVLAADDPTQVLGVLDWELATLGDPLMDLGNLLAYWVQADDNFIAQQTRRQPTHLPGMFTRQQVIDYYCEQMGLDPLNMAFYEVFGLFRLSVIAQQIYYRYHHGQTDNKAFKNFWFIVNYLHWRARRLIKQYQRKGHTA